MKQVFFIYSCLIKCRLFRGMECSWGYPIVSSLTILVMACYSGNLPSITIKEKAGTCWDKWCLFAHIYVKSSLDEVKLCIIFWDNFTLDFKSVFVDKCLNCFIEVIWPCAPNLFFCKVTKEDSIYDPYWQNYTIRVIDSLHMLYICSFFHKGRKLFMTAYLLSSTVITLKGNWYAWKGKKFPF